MSEPASRLKIIMFAFIGDELHYVTSTKQSHAYWLDTTFGIKGTAYEHTILGEMHNAKPGGCSCAVFKGTLSDETALTGRQIAAIERLWRMQFPQSEKLCIFSGRRQNLGSVPVMRIEAYDRHGTHFMDYADLWNDIDYKNAIEEFTDIHAMRVLKQKEDNPMEIIYYNID